MVGSAGLVPNDLDRPLEPLHQILHLISESIERDELETLVESIADSLGQDAFGRLAVALIQRAIGGIEYGLVWGLLVTLFFFRRLRSPSDAVACLRHN